MNKYLEREVAYIMANEIMDSLETSISYYEHEPELKNKKLIAHTIAIEKLISGTKRNMFEIAARLLVIRNENLFEDDFKDVFDYASKMLGYKKSMVYKLITVAEKFIEQTEKNGYNSIIAHVTEDYTVSQLIELNSIEPHEAFRLDEHGVITPSMTTKQIREVVKAYKNGEIDDYGEYIIDEKTEKTEETETEHEKEIVDETALLIIETIDNISKILDDERIIRESLAVSKLREIKQFLNNLSL